MTMRLPPSHRHYQQQVYVDKFGSNEQQMQAGKLLSSLALQASEDELDKINEARQSLLKEAVDNNQPIEDWNAFVSEVLKRSGAKPPDGSASTEATS